MSLLTSMYQALERGAPAVVLLNHPKQRDSKLNKKGGPRAKDGPSYEEWN